MTLPKRKTVHTVLPRVVNKSTMPGKGDFGPGKKETAISVYVISGSNLMSVFWVLFTPYKMEYTSYLLLTGYFWYHKINVFIKVIFSCYPLGPFYLLAFSKHI